MKVFIDSNILMDFIFNRENFAQDARRILEAAICGKIEAAVSSLTVINTCYVAKHYGYSADSINNTLLKLMQYVKILGTGHEVVNAALASHWPDTEDACQYFTALSFGADAIVTRDAKGFALSEIPVVAPGELPL